MRQAGWHTFLLLVAIGCWVGLAGPGPSSAASEFYSWVAASGELVLTDDAGSIPSAGSRGPVSVHRYSDPPARSAEAPHLASVSRGYPLEPAGWKRDYPELAEPAVLEIAEAFAEDHGGGFVTQNGWVSLPGQAVGWSAPLYGFWSGRSIQSPLSSFKAHLKKLNRGAMPHRGANPHRPMQEQQATVGTLRADGAAVPCCLGQTHSQSGRRSGSRR